MTPFNTFLRKMILTCLVLSGFPSCKAYAQEMDQSTSKPESHYSRNPSSASVTPSIDVKLFHSVTAPANHPSGELGVGRGYKVISCGARVNYHGNGNMLTAIFPTDHNTCVAAAKDHNLPDPASLEIWAMGLYDPADAWQVQIFSASSSVAAHPTAQISVDPAYVMTGGGAQVKYAGYGNMLTATYPLSENLWVAESKDHLESDPASLIVYAIGIKPTNPSLPPPQTRLFAQSSLVAAHPAQVVSVTDGFTLTGGGARDEYCGSGNMLVGSYPSDSNIWAASGKDHIDPDPTRLVVYAIGIGNASVSGAHSSAVQKPTPLQPPLKNCEVSVESQSVQSQICTSPAIRVAMQIVEDRAIHDPSGQLLSLFGALVTGVNATAGRPLVIASKVGSDGGRYTSKDPGSFVCRGLFIRGEVNIKELPDADAAADITAAAADELMKEYPTFVEWFKAKPLQDGSYILTLLPSSIQLSQEYSTEFTLPRGEDRTIQP